MNTDLTMLGASALLTALLASGKGVAMWTYWPVAEVLGNRDDPPALPAWAWRADRAHRNMLENFPHFAAFVLLANVAGLVPPDRSSAPRSSSGLARRMPSSTSRESGASAGSRFSPCR
jgi:uncharacterized MAPEG superfamily protein